MKTTRPAPVSSAFLMQANDAYIVISSTALKAEITLFLNALEDELLEMCEPDNDMELLSVAEQLEALLVENVVSCGLDALIHQLKGLQQRSRRLLLFRLHQLNAVLNEVKQTRFGETYLVAPAWKGL